MGSEVDALSMADPKGLVQVQESKAPERVKEALVRVLEGEDYRSAAKAVGYADHQLVYRWAKKLGLTGSHKEELKRLFRELSSLSGRELERRLQDPAELDRLSTKDLTVVVGIVTDKVAKLDGLDAGAVGHSFAQKMAATLDRILAMGGASITVEPAKRVVDTSATAVGEETSVPLIPDRLTVE